MKDVSYLLHQKSYYVFLEMCYKTLLGRMPGNGELRSHIDLLINGMPYEGLIYRFYISEEFCYRFEIKEIERYKKSYDRYIKKERMRATPVLGSILGSAFYPKKILRILKLLCDMNEKGMQYYLQSIEMSERMKGSINSLENTNRLSVQDLEKTIKEDLERQIVGMGNILSIQISDINAAAQEQYNGLRYLTEEFRAMDDILQRKIADIMDRMEQSENQIGGCFELAKENGHQISRCLEQEKENESQIRGCLEQVKQNKYDISRCRRYFIRQRPTILPLTAKVDIEKQALFTANFSSLSNFLKNYLCGETVHADGYYIESVFEDFNGELKKITAINKNHNQSMDNLVMTNPQDIYKMICEEGLNEIYRKIKHRFIFTMPFFGSVNGISVVWDKGFSEDEKNEKGDLYRWYTGQTNKCSLSILNNDENVKKITLTCVITSVDKNAEVYVDFPYSRKCYCLSEGYAFIEETFFLETMYNEIVFMYYGIGFNPEGNDPRFLKFCIQNLQIEELRTEDPIIYKGDALYRLQNPRYNYLPWSMLDAHICSALHKTGFFEVESYRIGRVCGVEWEKTTRYDYKSDCDNSSGYYIVDECGNDSMEEEYLRLYVANRKGDFQRYGGEN